MIKWTFLSSCPSLYTRSTHTTTTKLPFKHFRLPSLTIRTILKHILPTKQINQFYCKPLSPTFIVVKLPYHPVYSGPRTRFAHTANTRLTLNQDIRVSIRQLNKIEHTQLKVTHWHFGSKQHSSSTEYSPNWPCFALLFLTWSSGYFDRGPRTLLQPDLPLHTSITLTIFAWQIFSIFKSSINFINHILLLKSKNTLRQTTFTN